MEKGKRQTFLVYNLWLLKFAYFYEIFVPLLIIIVLCYKCQIFFGLFHDDYVRWTQTPDSHIFSVVRPDVRKEEIRVEVEVSTYMSIRTEAVDGERELARKFWLPEMVDVNGITAGYEDEVLTVWVPWALVSRGFFIDLSDLPGATEVLATARVA